jgi:hypothetical protein
MESFAVQPYLTLSIHYKFQDLIRPLALLFETNNSTLTGGFRYINMAAAAVAGGVRQGQVVARFSF